MPVGDLAAEIAVVATAVVIVLVAVTVPRRAQPVAAVVALAGLAVAATLLAVRLGDDPALTFSGTWSLDHVTVWAELVVVAVTALTVVLSPEWLRTDSRHGEWYALVLFSAAGAMVVAAASDLVELVVGVLLSSVTGYVLAAWHRRSALSVEAGARFFLVGALTNSLLLVGITLLYGLTGETRYQLVAQELGPGTSAVVLTAVVVLVVVGLGFEVGSVPSHAWLPDVAQGAPAPAAAFLTVAPKVGGLVAMARLLPLIPEEVVDWRAVVAVVAVATMTLGNLLALWQDDLRRLLGWSSISQAGYALLAVVVVGRSPDALPALIVFVAAYAAGQMAAFAVVARLRGRTALDDYRGLFGRRPVAATALALALLSFVGIPPLAGFVGKLLLFGAAIDGGYTWLAVVAVANTVVSLFYYLRVIAPMALEPADDVPPLPVLGPWAAVATVLGGVLVVAVGVGVEPLLDALSGTALLP